MINISRVERTNLPDIIASEIKNRILNNVWEVGDKIPSENDLSKEFEVNRLTIRLAINKLNTLGLLETKTGEGTYVRKLNLYNYINQIIPFIVSSNEINHILEFENTILSLLKNEVIFDDKNTKLINKIIDKTDENIKKLALIHFILKSYDDDIVEEIANDFFTIKRCIFEKTTNSLIKSIIISLEKILIENDIEKIKNLNPNELTCLVDRINKLIMNYK
ncbi:FadR/GntR family transcriptional regulator [Helcococcus kunzii]|uniref:FadR/GntR family transcriptional regulator n=1 Tax=Helcococcus kunzii TaxID=40091 RepID=UPI0021A81954|nr:GntR family transcriptional regulator [Helcococcus kunzii]MCT1796865.1 GntR family transcriptional regulator [Helcococcus kunzii]MCT1989703.1 GntR family transcriptional regulator [Helcococcus kunzii]